MEQKRGGFVPLGDVAGALELPGGRVPPPRPATLQARHHFTMLDQVTQLVEASETEPDIGFMARLLALCSLPRTNPGNRLQYKRVNGPYTLVMFSSGETKLPYGTLPPRRVFTGRTAGSGPSRRRPTGTPSAWAGMCVRWGAVLPPSS